MLQLFYKPTCPFCHDVFTVSDELGVEFDLRDISEYPEFVDELIEKGGKQQVPFLIDTDRGEQMYESDAIIAYIKQHHTPAAGAQKPRIHVSDNACVSCEG